MFDPQFLVDAWPVLAAIAAVIGAVWVAIRRIAPVLRRIGHLLDDLAGEPARPGSPPRPGVMERLQTLDQVTAELRPNGGGSMKDVVHRLDRRTERLDQRLALVEQRLAAVERLAVPNRQE